MDEFLKTMAENMSAAGIDAKFDGMHLTVAGFRFDAEKTWKDDKGRKVVRFQESNFVVDRRGNFDTARAMGLVLKQLPRLLQARLERERRANFGAMLHEFVAEGGFAKTDAGSYFNGAQTLSYSDAGISVVTTVQDLPSLRAVLGRLA